MCLLMALLNVLANSGQARHNTGDLDHFGSDDNLPGRGAEHLLADQALLAQRHQHEQ